MAWVDLREDAKVVAVTRGRKWHARVAEEQREDRGESCPHDEGGRHETGPRPVQSFHKRGDDVALRRCVGRAGKLAPWDDAEDRDVHHDVDHCDEQNRKQHRARDGPSRIFYFATEEANVVIAPVIVNRDEQRSAQPGEEFGAQGECARWKIECEFWIKMCNTREDYPQNRQHHADPQKL